MSGKNRKMNKAKVAKNDEFYTQLTDIEREMRHYKAHFKGKTIFCPCDDPYASNFFKYFAMNFEHLGLKRLITACYKGVDMLSMSKHDTDQACWLEYTGDKNGNRVPDPDEIGIHYFEGDGDFRSKESLALMREADIVVTNPPFSLFRDFARLLIEEKKKFLIIGNVLASINKDMFPFIQGNLIWLGVSPRSMEFETPDGGLKSVNACWYTNVSHRKRNEFIPLFKAYNPKDYPKYDNYDAIEVGQTKNIPMDYDGVMGVPVTFIDKYNPDQFEIMYRVWNAKVNGKTKYSRILIRHRRPAETGESR